ncbi:gluconokinase, GntK/IdnK-type [Enterobacillus tribolii]|uniref:Gluconokinase n=1 Tax=Enterobacillus tribolii TaxID=1487935 RepID=A0A370R0V4_9GAMM|nr:gluconokinase, GntK/IdnK-type [Enterobacillus tribolii]RDK95541.1 gluconate kinase (SKI family) [Enterobacillus tribolii]
MDHSNDINNRPAAGKHRLFVIMGVSGSGKSVVAQKLSQRLGIPCLDGDFLHPRANVDKMAGGNALNDDERLPWLQALNEAAYAMLRTNPASLLVCSALKKRYRDILRQGNPHLSFLFMNGEYGVIEERLKQRKGHFFRPQMLDSQFSALELPDATEKDVTSIDIHASLDVVVEKCAQLINETTQA